MTISSILRFADPKKVFELVASSLKNVASPPRQSRWSGVLVLLCLLSLCSTSWAQQPNSGTPTPGPPDLSVLGITTLPPSPVPAPPEAPAPPSYPTSTGPTLGPPVGVGLAIYQPTSDSSAEVLPVGCASCGTNLLPKPIPSLPTGPVLMPPRLLEPCCTGEGCYPGREPCDGCCTWMPRTYCGRVLAELFQSLCCPDPCYQPRFVPLANAAFFTDQARPVTQMRLRGDFGWDVLFPDKAEWFRAQQRGGAIARRLAYRDGYLLTEGATERFGAFVELNYRNISPDAGPGGAGFGDMRVGTKSLLLDCELMQLTMQMITFIPTGSASKGVGTGHVSLEPSLLMAMKLAPTTYFQGQLAYRFPIGGTPRFEGPVFHYHMSLNHLLCQCGQDIQLIGTAELNGYDIAGGQYTDLGGRLVNARGLGHMLSAGPGVRLSICDTIDFGVGSAFAITTDRMAGQLIRAEFRWRF